MFRNAILIDPKNTLLETDMTTARIREVLRCKTAYISKDVPYAVRHNPVEKNACPRGLEENNNSLGRAISSRYRNVTDVTSVTDDKQKVPSIKLKANNIHVDIPPQSWTSNSSSVIRIKSKLGQQVQFTRQH
ncbi:hypothetical protein TNCV_2149431 [Trichonephila clavipes]|nr:hypothetical protein TNCV_2149431 [Trichonephila clavipes]